MLCANIVFPAPGGPMRIALCPPAQAISSARFTVCCPRTSANWGPNFVDFGWMDCFLVGAICFLPAKNSAASLSDSTPIISISEITLASLALDWGMISPLKPSFFAKMAMLKTPFTGFTCPSNASSPITIYWLSNFSGI